MIPALSSNPAFSYPTDLNSVWKNISVSILFWFGDPQHSIVSECQMGSWRLFFPFQVLVRKTVKLCVLETSKTLGNEDYEEAAAYRSNL